MTSYPIRYFGSCGNPDCERYPCSFFCEESLLFRLNSVDRKRSTKCSNCRCSESSHDLLYIEVTQGVFLDCRPHCRPTLVKPVLFPASLDSPVDLPPRDLERDDSFRKAASSHTPGDTINVFRRLGLMSSASNGRLVVPSPTPSTASTLVLSDQTEDEIEVSPEKRSKYEH